MTSRLASGMTWVLRYVLVAAAVTVANVPTLLRGTPPTGSCGQLVPLLPHLQRFQNCDTPVFDLLAVDYGKIFEATGITRQARPGYMALGWLTDRVIQVISLGHYDPWSASAPTYATAEWGYLVLNALILTGVVFLALGLFGPQARRVWGVTALVLVLLTANPVTRAFFWTAHTQLFNLLVPVLAVGLVSHALASRWSARRATLVGLSLGLGLITYGTFAVAIISVIVTLLASRQVRSALVVTATAVAPAAMWWVFVVFKTGGFFSPETTNFRQFVWILDGLSHHDLLSQAIRKTGWFLVTFADAQTFLALALSFVMLVAIAGLALTDQQGSPVTDTGSEEDASRVALQLRAIAIVLPVQVAFLWLMGFYQTRLSWGLMTTFTIALGLVAVLASNRALTGRRRSLVNVGALVIALAWYLTWLAIPGPWH